MEKLTLGKLLAHSCSNPVEEGEWGEYVIELHCVQFIVIAKPLGDEQYEIRNYSIQDN